MYELLKGAGLVFLLRATGAGLAFALNVAIGRLLGASGAGLYFLSLSVVSVAAVIARLGLENTVLRFVSTYADEENWGLVRGVLRYALIWSGGLSLMFSVAAIVGAPLIAAWVFGAEGLAPVLAAIGFSIVTYNVMMLSGVSLQGLGRMRDSTLTNSVLYPLAALALIWPAVSVFGPVGAAFAYLAGTAFAAVSGLLIWHRAMSGKPVAKRPPGERMRASSRPLLVSTVVNRAILPWAPIFLLGIWSDSADVGIFAAATRVALLVSFFLVAVNTVLGPRFAALHTRGDIATIERLARQFALIITIVACPAFLILILAGNWIMGLFGPDFVGAGRVLSILALGQAVNAMTGPVAVVLMMGGRENDMRTLSLISMVVVVGLALILIPYMGVTGAAIATSAGNAVSSLVAVAMVRVRFGVWLVPFPF